MARYFSKKVEINGIIFDSEMESKYYEQLLIRQEKGEISHLTTHKKIVLVADYKYKDEKVKGLTYEYDFGYYEIATNTLYIEDVKGFAENEFKQQWKLTQSLILNGWSDPAKCIHLVHSKELSDHLVEKGLIKGIELPEMRIIKYSKTTGFVELKDYKKAMASAKKKAIMEKNEAISERDQIKKDLLKIKTLRSKVKPLTKLQTKELETLLEKYKDVI